LPEHNLTLRLGDTTSRNSLMGQSLFFGGLQIGTNFGLRPGFITQPIPTLKGTSVAPSTVDLYINDALRKTGSVPAGPFTLDDMTAITGTGQARVVVRDVLGRETVITQDFFTSSQLLKQGLSDWSYELGKLRRNLGTLNADYAESFSSGVYRYGLSNESTLEGNAQVSRTVKVLGLGLTQALPMQLLGEFGVSTSRADTVGTGQQYLLGVQHHSQRQGYTLRLQGYSRDYRRVGYDVTNDQSTKRVLSASYNYNGKAWGSVGVGYARSENYVTAPLNTYTANYSTTVGQRSSLLFNLTRVTGASSGTSFGVSLIIPLDGGLISTSNVSHATNGGGTSAYTSVVKPLGDEIGWGWRALAGAQSGGHAYGEAGVTYQGSSALATADAAASSQSQALRLGLRGGLAVADGHVVLSRRVENAMALVEVPGFADVGIGLQGGKDLARTDASGVALLPRLTPYHNNQIQLNAKDLPISAEIDNTEMRVVPANRTAVKVAFPVRSGRAALIKLVLDDGQPAPAGAELELIGDKREFYVARRGEAFVTAMQNVSELRLKHNGQSCTVKVELPPQKDDDIARVGPLTCSGVKR
jgi:outer membrane usher protein